MVLKILRIPFCEAGSTEAIKALAAWKTIRVDTKSAVMGFEKRRLS